MLQPTKPEHHHCQACALEPGDCDYHAHWTTEASPTETRTSGAYTLQREKPLWWEAPVPQLEKSQSGNKDPAQPKMNEVIKNLKSKNSGLELGNQLLLLFSH